MYVRHEPVLPSAPGAPGKLSTQSYVASQKADYVSVGCWSRNARPCVTVGEDFFWQLCNPAMTQTNVNGQART
jgi:hypothetical protein